MSRRKGKEVLSKKSELGYNMGQKVTEKNKGVFRIMGKKKGEKSGEKKIEDKDRINSETTA